MTKDLTVAYVIGNGLSRKGIDLNALKEKAYTIGCNEIYKEFSPDYLVALDYHMPVIEEIYRMENKPFVLIGRNCKSHILRNGEVFSHMSKIMDGKCNNSGILAIWYAAHELQVKKIYLIGFDFFRPVPSDDDRFKINGKRANDITNGNYWTGPAPYMAWGVERIIDDHPELEIVRCGEIFPWDEVFYYTQFRNMQFQFEMPQ